MALNKCNNCHCDCHCNIKGHSDNTGVCPCEQCNCDHNKSQDKTYESGGLVIDDTGECDSCQ